MIAKTTAQFTLYQQEQPVSDYFDYKALKRVHLRLRLRSSPLVPVEGRHLCDSRDESNTTSTAHVKIRLINGIEGGIGRVWIAGFCTVQNYLL